MKRRVRFGPALGQIPAGGRELRQHELRAEDTDGLPDQRGQQRQPGGNQRAERHGQHGEGHDDGEHDLGGAAGRGGKRLLQQVLRVL
jgi:hypothetical protein